MKKMRSLMIEKIPFFILMIISCVITFHAQHIGGAVVSVEKLPFAIRLENALVSYIHYIIKMVWPSHLSVFYPHPGMPPAWEIIGSVFILICCFIFVIIKRNEKPYMLTGWLWFTGTLIPVIGLVQIGSHAMADRFAYIPFIGLYIIISWGMVDIAASHPIFKMILPFAVGAAILLIMTVASAQIHVWKDSISVFKHAINVTENNYLAHDNLGVALAEKGQGNLAIEHYRAALNIKPDYAKAHNNLAVELMVQGKFEKAIEHFHQAVRIKPDLFKVYLNLGVCFLQTGNIQEAQKQFQTVLMYQSDNIFALLHLGKILAKSGAIDESIQYFKKIVLLRPENVEACYYLASIYSVKREEKEAAFWLQKAAENGFSNWQLLEASKNFSWFRSTKSYQMLFDKKSI